MSRIVLKSIPAGLFGFVLLVSGCASMAGPSNAAQTEKDLLTLHEQWAQARIDGDVAFLERFYGQELRLLVMDGNVNSRAADIAMLDHKGKPGPQVIKPDYIKDVDMHVAVYDDAAIVSGVENVRGIAFDNPPGSLSLRFTNVLVWRDGRWQLVRHQSTPVQAQQSVSSK